MRHLGDIVIEEGAARFVPASAPAYITPAAEYRGSRVRIAVRAVVRDGSGNVALISAKGGKHHKNPGGGVDAGEDLGLALAREVDEEAGASVRADGELGAIVQYDEQGKPFHVSFGYLCTVEGQLRERHLTDKEVDEQFRLLWVSMEEATSLLLDERHDDDPLSDSIRARELAYLEAAR